MRNLNKLQTEHYKNLRKGEFKIKSGVIYSDLYEELSNIRKIIYHVSVKTLSPEMEEKIEWASN